MITISITETDFFLPEDGATAEQKFLEFLNTQSETWICAFGFTLQPMFDAILKADANGVKIHILLDHSQSVGHAEAPKVKNLVANIKNGDVTITTAGIDSSKKSQIWHWKGMTTKSLDPTIENQCWEGSTNFSESAWYQGNSARIFNNNVWSQVFIDQFNLHKAWARENEPQYQLMHNLGIGANELDKS